MNAVHGNNRFGDLLRTQRIRRGMTQTQLADLSTISVRAIRDLELGRTGRPRYDTTQLIAEGLGLIGRDRTDFDAAAGHAAAADAFELIRDSESARPPASLGAIVGREAETEALADILTSAGRRLVTIIGLSGVGKSRLALEVAETVYRSHGIPVLWAAPPGTETSYRIAPAQDQLSHLIRDALDGLFDPDGDAAGRLSTLIGDRRMVLVLDGYDESPGHADQVVSLLQKSHELRILRTTRTSGGIPGEQTSPLAPLTVPESGDGHSPTGLAKIASVQMLLSHIRMVRPEFSLTTANSEAIAELCWRLDGVPAALEMAASWLLVCEPQDLLAQVRANPFEVIGQPGHDGGPQPGLGVSLSEAIGSLSAPETTLMEHLTSAGTGMSVAEIVEVSGIPVPTCWALVRRLLMHGVLRQEGSGTMRFRTLNLIQFLHERRRRFTAPYHALCGGSLSEGIERYAVATSFV
ncbi:helix-turn-helix domain-containing protein [Streptosporangiaceae bacterium NEAU-GS5]|nr:helix-turn-helix domain-containing protein [Streptosporangiaceae bacterium NEAU-GS5]